MRTIIFDLDGTLYEDERVYDLFACEMASRLPSGKRDAYLHAWEAAKRGESPARIGTGYDAERDLLFRHNGIHMTEYLDWSGKSTAVRLSSPAENAADEPVPPTETPVFGEGRYNNGDWWGIATTVAAHHGIDRDAVREAFFATRNLMHAEDFDLRVDVPFMDVIGRLHTAGIYTIALSNSPEDSVQIVIDRLGIRPSLDRVIGQGKKPTGLTALLGELGGPAAILSVGDNFINDIQPALAYGSSALYIDRHDSRLGIESPLCHLVPSISAARNWLASRYFVASRTRP